MYLYLKSCVWRPGKKKRYLKCLFVFLFTKDNILIHASTIVLSSGGGQGEVLW